jgi:hypothetical protein
MTVNAGRLVRCFEQAAKYSRFMGVCLLYPRELMAHPFSQHF